ncbi:MAG TPA: hypothetical protein VJN18_01005 [Polyangiaceae bacterium]|nr:hypothetical protein [Polyangiaceae bacterium]
MLCCATLGCVRDAVLENDVRSAQWKARTLSTQSDLNVAEAALAAQLVELEALYQRDPGDPRVLGLLDAGYGLLAQGFIEARRLAAVSEGDSARVAKEVENAAQAEARAKFYRASLSGATPSARMALTGALSEAERACQRHERQGYERQLHALLVEPEGDPEQRLKRALLRRLASAWLLPGVSARCGF